MTIIAPRVDAIRSIGAFMHEIELLVGACITGSSSLIGRCHVHGMTLYDAAVDLCQRAKVLVPWLQPPRARGSLAAEPEKRNS
jgi:hypothetical protein